MGKKIHQDTTDIPKGMQMMLAEAFTKKRCKEKPCTSLNPEG